MDVVWQLTNKKVQPVPELRPAELWAQGQKVVSQNICLNEIRIKFACLWASSKTS